MRSTIGAISTGIALVVGVLICPPNRATLGADSRITTIEPTRAERKLINAAAKGVIATYLTGVVAHDDPHKGSEWDADRTLRAEVIYKLITGANPAWSVGVSGVRVLGARITGFLNLEGATLKYPLAIERSFIYEPINLKNASSRSISFAGSYLAGSVSPLQYSPLDDRLCLLADGLQADGSIMLNDGFTGIRGVQIADANIKGNLDCGGSALRNPGGFALNAAGTVITGDVRLNDGFSAKGGINLRYAEIGRELIGTGGDFENRAGDALDACYIRVKGNVLLNNGFNATGKVCLAGAEIGGNLYCSGGKFHRGDQADAPVLDLEQSTVGKTLYLFGSIPDGSVDLSFAHVHVLSDDRDGWPLPGQLALDGFVYDELDPTRSPTDAQSRIAWLALQRTNYFSIQPYEQLSKVLNEMGYFDDAKDILMAEHEAIRIKGNLGTASWLGNWILYLLVGYGYRVWYCLLWAFGAVSIGAFIFRKAANSKILVTQDGSSLDPSGAAIDPNSSTEQEQKSCLGQLDQLLYYYVYSLEVFLPFSRFHEREVLVLVKRRPNDWPFHSCKAWYVFEESFGWIITGFVVAALSGLIK